VGRSSRSSSGRCRRACRVPSMKVCVSFCNSSRETRGTSLPGSRLSDMPTLRSYRAVDGVSVYIPVMGLPVPHIGRHFRS
jgi:hypothetical protein